jgi:predicted membrane channel-forming protein YqfA (hemolysin III family)
MQTHESQPNLLRWLAVVAFVEFAAVVAVCALIFPREPAALIMVILLLGWLGVIALGLKRRSSKFVETRAPERRPRMRLSVRGMMYIVGGFALVFWPARYVCHVPPDTNLPNYHGMMAFFCEEEAKLFQSRADACLARAKNGTPWDDSSEDSEGFRLCPYPSDQRRHDSWLEQAAIWERASVRARRAARRHLSHW